MVYCYKGVGEIERYKDFPKLSIGSACTGSGPMWERMWKKVVQCTCQEQTCHFSLLEGAEAHW